MNKRFTQGRMMVRVDIVEFDIGINYENYETEPINITQELLIKLTR